MRKVNKSPIFGAIIFLIAVFLGTTGRSLADSGPVVVAALLPLTGKAAEWGRQSRIGVELALEELARDFPALKFDVRYEDNGLQGKQGLSALNSLLQQNKVSAVLSTSSPVGMAIKPLCARKRLPLLGAYTTVPSFIAPVDGWHPFRISTRLQTEISATATYLQAEPKRKLALFWLENEYGESWAGGMAKVLANQEIVLNEGFAVGSTDFRPLLLRAKAKGAELLLSCGIPSEIGLLIKQNEELGTGVQVLGCQASLGKELLDSAGASAEGFAAVACYDPEAGGDANQNFVKMMRSRLNDEVSIYSLEPYLAMKLIGWAAAECGADSECILRRLAQAKDLSSPIGPLSFSPEGELERSCRYMKVVKGQFR